MSDDYEQMRRAVALVANSLLADRSSLARTLGMQYDGRRDVYASAGYPQTLDFEDYRGAYRRQDIARRIVGAKPAETWRLQPTVLDGANVEDGKDDTEFAKAISILAEGSDIADVHDTRLNLWHILHRLDRVSRIGRYGVLYIGVRDGKDPAEPLERGAARGVEDLLYMSVYAEGAAALDTLDTDPTSPRFGLPEFYRLTAKAGDGVATKEIKAHWTRCIHVAEDVDEDELYGTPALEACWNRLVDLLKIMASSGEAAWRLSNPGYSITAGEGKRLPVDEAAVTELQGQIEDFIDGLTRYLLLEGLTPQAIEGAIQDPTGLVTINVALISAATGIPQRILLGSERGELASQQDERGWTTQIETRQINHVQPGIVVPVVGRLIYAGVLPTPSSGKMSVKWAPLLESDRKAEAETAKAAADALAAVGAEVDPVKFAEVYLPEVPADAIEKKEPAPVPPALAQLPIPGASAGADGAQGAQGAPTPANDTQDGSAGADDAPAANVDARLLMAQDAAGNWYYAYP